jgi:hypothetical protein
MSSEEFARQMETAAAKTGDVEPGNEKPLSQSESMNGCASSGLEKIKSE